MYEEKLGALIPGWGLKSIWGDVVTLCQVTKDKNSVFLGVIFLNLKIYTLRKKLHLKDHGLRWICAGIIT